MTELDDIAVPAALDLIDEFGVLMTFTVPVGTHDPTTGLVSGGTPDPKVWKAAPIQGYHDRYIDGTVIQVGDGFTFVAASGINFTPTKGMTVNDGTDDWRCLRIQPLIPGAQVAAYKLHLRK